MRRVLGTNRWSTRQQVRQVDARVVNGRNIGNRVEGRMVYDHEHDRRRTH